MTNSYIIRIKDEINEQMVEEWLKGISYGLKATGSAIEFNVIAFPGKRILIRTNSIPLWQCVITTLTEAGDIQRNLSPED